MLNINEIEESVRQSMNIVDNDIFKQSLVSIAKIVKEKLERTLGPYAHTTIIEDGTFKYPTKDGWNIAKRVHFNDPFYQSLYGFLLQISTALVSKVGDGTTTAFVAASNFINEIQNENGDFLTKYQQTEIASALEEVCKDIEHIIKDEKNDLIRYIDKGNNYLDIYKIALLSSNGNKDIANVIRKIYQETGNPNIYVSTDKCLDIEYEIQTGFKLDCRLINAEIYRNTDDGSFYSESNIMVSIFDHNISFSKHGSIIGLLSTIAAEVGKTLLIVAPNFDDTIMSIMGSQLNKLAQSGQMPNLMFLQVSLTKTLHKKYFKDFSVISNSAPIDMDKVHLLNILLEPDPDQKVVEELNRYKEMLNLDSFDPKELIKSYVGRIEGVRIDKNQLICKLDTNSLTYRAHFDKVKREYEEIKSKNEKYSTNSIEFMDEYLRYSRLLGKMGIIKVGGYSDIEKACLKDSVDDAVLACKSAYTNGYVRGMNLTSILALIIEETNLRSVECNDNYTKLKFHIVSTLLKVYLKTTSSIFKNKYPEYSEDELISITEDIVGKCNTDKSEENSIKVYNIVTEEYEDFNDIKNLNVINSSATDIEILKAITGILTLILTSDQMLSVNKFLGLKQTKSQFIKEKSKEYSEIFSTVLSEIKLDLIDIFRGNELFKINGHPVYPGTISAESIPQENPANYVNDNTNSK